MYKRIRELREITETKQETIAKLLRIQQSYYSKQERGLKPFKIEQIRTLCLYYNISADYLLDLPKGLRYPKL